MRTTQPLPNPSYQWRNGSSMVTTQRSEFSWVLRCDGMTVRDNFGFPIVFETSWDAKNYARTSLGYENIVLTLS
tara:strand:- start:3822 stop:4043 length:222 start_codon:yes stop_codon:yes gene_type:complete